MKSKGAKVLMETTTKDSAYEFIRNNQPSHKAELLMYCGGQSLAFGGGYIYYVVEMPDISDDELVKLEMFINSNAVNSTERSVCKIAFWVKFWSIFAIISIVVGAIILLLTL